MSDVVYRGYTFPSNYSNHTEAGAPVPRNKLIHYPGVKGSVNLNMQTAERPIAHTGAIRVTSQGAMSSVVGAVESICDGERGSLVMLGRTFTSVYCDTISWGQQTAGVGFRATPTAPDSYYLRLPFTINYIQIRP